ncbi:UPF0434 protein ycaR [Desulfovibrio sp. X2]|uniref:Trm112 family protein n=1 Tax=Desulfovibrio sp. X2 TaxID=941449 RepID=UPI000358B726|nr:Trm112 family protein [Desulfovibrio sp. X2]EPR41244.1 UPF0434 protein ycaR [Desulfovibrio sp. X2]
MSLNTELLSILVCPKCKGDIELTPEQDGLICKACNVAYPVVDEIPVMLVEEAIPLADWPAKRPSAKK